MSSGKMPEYTMLTPLSLTPDVMPQHDFEQLVGLGLTLPCDLLPHPHHYPSFVNMVGGPALGPTLVLENNLHNDHNDRSPDPPRSPATSPEVDEDEDEDYHHHRRRNPPSPGGNSNSNNSLGGGDSGGEGGKDPFAPQCKIPLPTPFSPYEYWLEPSFIRRRNERERQRVRNVNDGFERLKGHLPIHAKDKDKRLSKVEILRMAIRYIRNLQDMLTNDGLIDDNSKENMVCIQSDSDD